MSQLDQDRRQDAAYHLHTLQKVMHMEGGPRYFDELLKELRDALLAVAASKMPVVLTEQLAREAFFVLTREGKKPLREAISQNDIATAVRVAAQKIIEEAESSPLSARRVVDFLRK